MEITWNMIIKVANFAHKLLDDSMAIQLHWELTLFILLSLFGYF